MDPMGNYTGYEETEEERRRRLAAEATPVTQTIKTNPVTGEQEMTIKGTPQDLSAANPRTPTVSGAVSPDQIFQRQIQAESGGQHIDPRTGQILTSPKGAQGIGQIMPSTAAQPGYGIRPASPEEIATREGNLSFADRYKQGMLQTFGGDQQKATAAYNAGPGAIKRAEQQAAASGGAWTDYIPKETMAYLGKVFGNMMPTAQASTLPPGQLQQQPSVTVAPTGSVTSQPTTSIAPTAQAAPEAAPAGPVNPMYAFNATGGAPGLRMPDAMQQQQAMEMAQRNQAVNEFQTATKNPDAMIDYMARKDVPDDLKTAMKINHFEALSAEKRQRDMEEKAMKIVTEQPQKIPRMMNDPSEEGSLFKAWLYNMIGFKAGVEAETAKMNLPSKWLPAEADGKSGMVLYSTSGRPLQGVNSDNTKMTPEELATFASAGTTKRTKPDVSMQDVEKGDMKGRVVTTYDRQNRPTTVVESGGKTYAYDASWKPVSIGTAGAKAEQAAQIKTNYAEVTAALTEQGKIKGELAKYGYAVQQVPGGKSIVTKNGAPVPTDANGQIQLTDNAGTAFTLADLQAGKEISTSTAKKVGESNVAYSDTLAKDRQNSLAQTSTINRIQSAIDKNPEFWGITSNSPGWNAFVNAQSNEDKAKALNKLYTELNIPTTKRTEFDAVANDYRNLQVSTITSSGLSASQLNTEGESQRVINQIGSMGDRPGAAKAAMEFYKGKIEYNDAKARAWVKARKTNPNLDRLEFETDFDEGQGKVIYDKISQSINKIREDALAKTKGTTTGAGPVAAPGGLPVGTEKDGWIYQGGNPSDKNNWKKK
jgi:YD repeat-containing protein